MEYPFAANLNIDDFAIVKVLQRNRKKFVAQISSGPEEDEDHEDRFLKRSLGFLFSEVDDLAFTNLVDVIRILPSLMPLSHQSMGRNFQFVINLDSYGV